MRPAALKERIRAAQVHAALPVNRELILLYWQVGRAILAQQHEHGWEAQVIELCWLRGPSMRARRRGAS